VENGPSDLETPKSVNGPSFSFHRSAAKLRGEEREEALMVWKRNGKRAFESELVSKTQTSDAKRP
jgi:hypothetical protein